MHLTLFTISAALFLITLSNALSVDTSHHLARHHQHIAARHPAAKRASDSGRCKKRTSTTPAAAALSSTSLPTSTPLVLAAPPASSSQAPPPLPSPASGKGKVGIAWSNYDNSLLKNFLTWKVSSVYNWSPYKPSDTYGLEYIPMLWGTKQIADFQNLVKAGYANTVLGFNEPDIVSGQDSANIDPVTAAQIWMANIQPLKKDGYRLVTPVVAHKKEWTQAFFAACDHCTFDVMAAHIYATNTKVVIDYLTDLHNTFNMPIWVTEFACQSFTGGAQCDEGQVFAFMTTLIEWMDNTVWIEKYFYFGMFNAREIKVHYVNALMNEDGTPTALGHLYIGS